MKKKKKSEWKIDWDLVKKIQSRIIIKNVPEGYKGLKPSPKKMEIANEVVRNLIID